MRKLFLFSLLALLPSLKTMAYDFEVDGIYYSLSENEAIVSSGFDKKGNFVILETVVYKEKTYLVAEIGARAFYSCYELISLAIFNSIQQ